MIRKIIVKNICIAICFLYGKSLQAQLNSETIKKTVSQNCYFSITDSKQGEQIQSFFAANNFNAAWFNTENVNNRIYLLYQLKLSADIGLAEKNYQYFFIENFRKGTAKLNSLADSLEAEIKFTAAALHYYNDIAYGNTPLAITYKGLAEIPVYHISELLAHRYCCYSNLLFFEDVYRKFNWNKMDSFKN